MNIRKDVYITMFIVVIDANSGDMEYMNVGHSVSPIVCGEDGPRELCAYGAPVSHWAKGMGRQIKSLRLKEGDRLLLYTDGAISPSDGESGEKRVRELFSENWTDADSFLKKVRGGGRLIADDFSAMIIEITGASKTRV